MKKLLFLLVVSGFFLFACDPYPYDYIDNTPKPEKFQLKGYVHDADSLWSLENIMVLMKPESVNDTFFTYTDSTGQFGFNFGRSYGWSAMLMFRDTAGVYDDLDTLFLCSERDFAAGLREFFVNL